MYLTKAAITNPGPGINKSKRNEQQTQCNKEGDTKVKSQDNIRKRCHKNIFINEIVLIGIAWRRVFE